MSLSMDPNHVFRDGPLMNPHEPEKWEVRRLLSEHQQVLLALISDATGLTLPNLLIRATDAGAGTANAIRATTNLSIPAGDAAALIALNVARSNTGPVSVRFGNGPVLPIKTNSGNDIAASGLAAGMIVVGFIFEGTFRLLSDQSSTAIIAAAENEANRAEDAADQSAASAVLAGGVLTTVLDPQFPDVPTTALYAPSAEPSYIRVAGNAAAGDGGQGLYKKITSPALGSELVVNGDFASSSGWTTAGGATISGGTGNFVGGVAQRISRAFTMVPGRTYVIQYDVATAFTAGGVRAQLYSPLDGSKIESVLRLAAGTYTATLVAPVGVTELRMVTSSSASAGAIDNVSVKEVLGGQFRIASGGWYELADGEVLARNFGIVIAPDDSTVALQRAIDYSDAKQDGPVQLPTGTFVVGDINLKGISLFGTGKTTLRKKTGSTRILDDGTTGSVKLKGLSLDGNNEAGGAFRYTQNVGILLEDIDLLNWIDRCAFFEQGTRDVRVRGGRVFNNAAADIYCAKGREISFVGLAFRDCTEHVIRFGRFNSDPDLPSGFNALVANCTFNNVANDPVLFELDARFGSVIGNQFNNCRRIVKCEGVAAAGADAMSRIVVADNVFTTQIGAIGEAIRGFGVRGMIVKGNSISTAHQGISVGEDSIVDGNVVDGITDNGIIVDGIHASISGNTLRSVSGIAIRSLANRTVANGNKIHTSGAGIRFEANDGVATGNIIATTGNGVTMTAAANFCTVTNNNLRGTTGTKISDAGSQNVTTPNFV